MTSRWRTKRRRLATTLDPLDSLVVRERGERVLDPHEIGLIVHALIDRLVRVRRLVEQPLSVRRLPRTPRHLLLERLDGQRPARLAAAHAAPSAVRARLVRRLVTQPHHEVGALPHRPRDQSPRTDPGVDRALARDPEPPAVVLLELGVVVVAV